MSQTAQKINTPDAHYDKFCGLDSKTSKISENIC